MWLCTPPSEDQADQVQGLVSGPGRGGRADQRVVVMEAAVIDGVIDAHQILAHDGAGPQRQVPHLGIPHLTIRQADRAAAGVQRGVGLCGQVRVQARCVGLGVGVVHLARIHADAVHDDQDHGAAWCGARVSHDAFHSVAGKATY
jgi:hypothetical protein